MASISYFYDILIVSWGIFFVLPVRSGANVHRLKALVFEGGKMFDRTRAVFFLLDITHFSARFLYQA